MRLRSIPPENISGELENLGTEVDSILLAIATDIDVCGTYDSQWLVATSERLILLDPRGGRIETTIYLMSELEDFRTSPAIGSGLLQARIDAVWVDVLRFSNRLKFHFDRVAEQLRRIKRGEATGIEQEEVRDPHRCPKCDLMLEFSGELCPRCIDHGAALGRIIAMMKPYWRASALMMGLLLMGIALDLVWPMLTRYLVDYVLAHKTDSQPYAFLEGMSAHRLLVLVVASLALVQLVRGVVTAITGRIAGSVGNALTYDVRSRLVDKLQRLGLSFYGKQETGSLVGRVAYDTEAVQSFLTQVTSGFFMQLLLVVFSFAMMMSLEPTLALWTLVPAPFVIGGAFVYWRYVHPHFQRLWDRSSKQAGTLNGILSGIRVVKAFGQEDNEQKRFDKSSASLRDARKVVDRTSALFYPIMAIVFQVGGWIVWYVGGREVLDESISLGTLMAFFGYLSMFYGPLGSLTNLTTWLTQFSTQMHRIFEILDAPEVLPQSESPTGAASARKGEIEFDDVTFGYSRGQPVLRNISLKVAAGSRIGIVGRSGSGKTSLINLLCRFYDVDSGSIRLDGVDVRELPKNELRSRISLVLQEPFLFRGTLAENVKYGRPEATPEEVIEAARAASAHDFVMSHPLGYETSVGERGFELSGGERQRVSIARALLCRAPVLVLDEATSSIDSESELAIQNALDDLSRNCTTVTIAHRLSTLQSCDRIFVIDGGQVKESGNHAELMASDGLYAQWVRIQQGKTYIETDANGTIEKPKQSQSDTRIRWLRPDFDRIDLGAKGQLQVYVKDNRLYRGVFALRCFPVHHPEEYLSLRFINDQDRVEELGVIRNLVEWPADAQRFVRQALERRYFFHEIKRIHSVRRFAQFYAFTAQTSTGRIEFIIRDTPDSAQDYGQRGKLLMDVEDNHYLIPDVDKLPSSDRSIFNRSIYW